MIRWKISGIGAYASELYVSDIQKVEEGMFSLSLTVPPLQPANALGRLSGGLDLLYGEAAMPETPDAVPHAYRHSGHLRRKSRFVRTFVLVSAVIRARMYEMPRCNRDTMSQH